jgi:hypothetical protein
MIQWIKDLFCRDQAVRSEFAFVEETLRARIVELERENDVLSTKLRAAARANSRTRQANVSAKVVKKSTSKAKK